MLKREVFERPSRFFVLSAPGLDLRNISFIHEIADRSVEDVTAEILNEAALPDIGATDADLQASRFDHIRDLRKHERA